MFFFVFIILSAPECFVFIWKSQNNLRGDDAPRPPYRGLVYKLSAPPKIKFTIRHCPHLYDITLSIHFSAALLSVVKWSVLPLPVTPCCLITWACNTHAFARFPDPMWLWSALSGDFQHLTFWPHNAAASLHTGHSRSQQVAHAWSYSKSNPALSRHFVHQSV